MRPAKRCISGVYAESLGCRADVTAYMHSVCSGRGNCTLLVATMDSVIQPCPKDFKSYLEITYECIRGKAAYLTFSVSNDRIVLLELLSPHNEPYATATSDLSGSHKCNTINCCNTTKFVCYLLQLYSSCIAAVRIGAIQLQYKKKFLYCSCIVVVGYCGPLYVYTFPHHRHFSAGSLSNYTALEHAFVNNLLVVVTGQRRSRKSHLRPLDHESDTPPYPPVTSFQRSISILPRDARMCVVRYCHRMFYVRPSVFLSVALMLCGHTGWVTSKVTLPIICFLELNIGELVQGKHPQSLGGIGVLWLFLQKIGNISETVQDRTKVATDHHHHHHHHHRHIYLFNKVQTE